MAEQTMTQSEAMEIVRADEIRKQKKRDALKKWRADPANGYKEYYAAWLKARKEKVELAKQMLGQ